MPNPDLRFTRAWVDEHALDALGLLVTGPIGSWDDLRAAELAIRAIVFHDTVEHIGPYFRMHMMNTGGDSFDISQSKPWSIPDSILKLFEQAKYKGTISRVDTLYNFPDADQAQKFIKAHAAKAEQKEQRLKNDPLEKEAFVVLDADLGQFEYVCENVDEYYSIIFPNDENLIRNFVSRIPSSNSPSYFGNSAYTDLLENYPGNRGGLFFKSIDEDWNQQLESWARQGLNIAIDLLLSIVLSRANERHEIPAVISELRDEFADARRELWNLFDDSFLRVATQEEAARVIERIEREARSIVPKSFKQHEFWFPLRFLWNFVPAAATWAGAISGFKSFKFGNELGVRLHMVDAARLLVNDLSDREPIQHSLSRVLNTSELTALELSFLSR